VARKTGQIIQKGPRKWLARVFLGRDATGKRRYHGRTIRGTKKDAQRYLNKALRDIDLDQFVEPSDRPLEDYLRDWLTGSAAARVTERTASEYEALLRLHIIPPLGDRKLSQLTAAEIQRVYNGMTERNLSARTIRYTHSVLRSALEQAVKWGLLSRNPTKHVDLPRMERRELSVLSVEELGRFLEAAREDRWYALWELLAATGMRPAEALGLKWTDIEGHRIRIQRSLVRQSDGKWTLKDPKTARARRTVTIPKTVEQTLQRHRKEQVEDRLKAGADYQDHGFVFAVSNGSPLDWKVVVQRHFKPVVKRASLPRTRPYDLRHTCATLLLAAGENVKVVSERLGHASAALTLDVYSHVLPDMQQGAAERMEGLLFGGAGR
jgi:integrase